MSVGSKINSSLGLVGRLLHRIPGRAWLALGCLLVAAFWLQQHDARVRQQVQLQQVRRQTSAEVAALQKQAQQAVKQANVENARAVQKLEARRRSLEQQNRQLAAKLAEMRKQAQTQAGEVATLPISEIVTRVAAQLGLKAQDLAAETSSRQGAKAQRQLQVTNDELPEAAGRSADIARAAASAPARKRPTVGNAPTMAANAKKSASAAPVLALTNSGARKVETALVELDSCRAESGIENQQISNCQARAQADEAAIQRLTGSVASLNQALAAKDKILRRQAGEYKAELRAARGTFLGRLAHVTEHVAAGVAIGVVIGVAVQ